MSVEPTIGLAFLAGLISFISPCVLPLVPAYVGYMGGRATAAAGDPQRNQFETFLHGVFFVLGFTLFFVGFGLLTAAASSYLTQIGVDIPTILTRLGGVAVILFGLYVMKALDPVFNRGLVVAKTLKENFTQALLFTLLVGGILFAYYLWVFEFFEDQAPVSVIYALILFLITLTLFRKPLQEAQSLGDFWEKAIIQLQVALISDTRQMNLQPNAKAQTKQTTQIPTRPRAGLLAWGIAGLGLFRRMTGPYFGSISMGVVFSAGWTPCIGPIYGSVLALANDSAAEGGSLLPAAGMLTAYSLGLGIPFLVTALALNQTTGLMRGLKRNMRKVEYASGILLILIGLLILSGNLEELSRQFGNQGELGDLSVRLEACSAGAAEGRIHLSTWTDCVTNGTPKLEDTFIRTEKSPTAQTLLTSLEPTTATSASDVSDAPLFVADPAFDPTSIEEGVQVGQLAPTFQTVTPTGEAIALADFYGDQVILLNFWATWCGPCRDEMPEFQHLYEDLQDQGFTVLAIDFLEPPDTVQAFVEDIGVSFPIGMDESGEINDDLYNVGQYPTSFIIDGHGIIRAIHAGPLTGEQLLTILDGIQAEDDA